VKLRIAALALLLAAAIALAVSGAYEALAPERLRATIEGLGPLGPVLFVVAFAVLEPLHFPGLIFLLTAPLVWPLPLAFALSLAGSVGAGVVALVVARWLARDWVQARMPDSFRAWDQRLAEHGFRTVVLIRLVTFLWPEAHWGIGLSSVRVTPAVVGSLVGFAPGIALFTWFGARMTAWFARLPRDTWLALAVVVVGGFAWRRARQAGRAQAAEG